MATVTEPVGSATTFPGEVRMVIRNVGWHVSETLVDAIGEGQHIRVAYDGKDMELMATGRIHEDFSGLFFRLVDALTEELEIPRSDAGETTWKRAEVARGLEADQCYDFLPEKLEIDREARARQSNAIADYPNPNLAVEIDISPSQVDRPAIYVALRIPEVWRFDGESVTIEHLQEDGTYAAVEASRFLPIRPDEVVRWLVKEDTGDKAAWVRRLRAWIRAELTQRPRPPQ